MRNKWLVIFAFLFAFACVCGMTIIRYRNGARYWEGRAHREIQRRAPLVRVLARCGNNLVDFRDQLHGLQSRVEQDDQVMEQLGHQLEETEQSRQRMREVIRRQCPALAVAFPEP